MTIGRFTIKPTRHYLLHHSDVEWELVIRTVLPPTKTHPNKRKGKDRFTYIKKFKKFTVEVHAKNKQDEILVINAFKME